MAFIDVSFPLAGLDVVGGYYKQPVRQIDDQVYARTTPIGVNVRAFESLTGRRRGGSRPGMVRVTGSVLTDESGLNSEILDLCVFVSSGIQPNFAASPDDVSGRYVFLLASVGGRLLVTEAKNSQWYPAINDTGRVPALPVDVPVQMVPYGSEVFILCPDRMLVYDPVTNYVTEAQASAGLLPTDVSGKKFCRLGCVFNGRLVLAGLESDPHNLFMSRVGEPLDFDYAPESPSALSAVAGSVSPFGLVGDVINGLAAFGDDVLVIFCDSSVWMMKGDPLQGGALQRYTDGIGGLFRTPVCVDPRGVMYFVSSRNEVYAIRRDELPMKISSSIDPLLREMDLRSNVGMAWDVETESLLIVVPRQAVLVWESRTGAWWVDRHDGFRILSVAVYDGPSPRDRAVLFGCDDGHVRRMDLSAETDDGYPIVSEVWIGPLQSETMEELMLHELQADMGEESGDVEWHVHVGRTAEAALRSSASIGGVWKAGRNHQNAVRRAGKAFYIRLSSTARWAMERIRGRIDGLGKVRRRLR